MMADDYAILTTPPAPAPSYAPLTPADVAAVAAPVTPGFFSDSAAYIADVRRRLLALSWDDDHIHASTARAWAMKWKLHWSDDNIGEAMGFSGTAVYDHFMRHGFY
jgi:hypothetical protein